LKEMEMQEMKEKEQQLKNMAELEKGNLLP
jgi:hypothetical protein